jgi:YD repeat-containing protein
VLLPNGMMTVYDYDEDHQHRMTKISHKNSPTGSVRASFAYDLDASGNILSVTDQDGTAWSYEYDARNRLTAAVMGVGGLADVALDYAYTYDERDNLLTKSGPFLDDFNRGNYNGWMAAGSSWDASSGKLVGEAP